MILPTMTNYQTVSHYKNDLRLCHERMDRLTDEWRRTLKKYPRSRIKVDKFRCRETFQDYLCIHTHVGKDIKRGLVRKEYAIVNDGNKKVYVATIQDYTKTVIHTTHFFERYRERTKRSGLTIEQAIGEFTYNTLGMATVYNNGKGRMVFATLEGICLCEYDDENENGKIFFRTFVSYDMLKGTQSEAWQIMQSDVRKLCEYTAGSKDAGSQRYREERDRLILELGTINYETAHKIYSQYFEK